MEQNTNYNLLYNKDFRMVVDKLSMVEYFLFEANIPSITSGTADVPNPFTVIPMHGDHLQFSPLSLTFRVDEDLKNYEQILNWMQSYGTPQGFTSYRDSSKSPNATSKQQHYAQYSEVTIFTSTNKDNPNVKFVFENAFPTDLGELTLIANPDNPVAIQCTATFHYTKFSIKR